jgi:hypothetical protein
MSKRAAAHDQELKKSHTSSEDEKSVCWYCSDSTESRKKTFKRCEDCRIYKKSIQAKDRELGIQRDQCYCCGTSKSQGTMSCIYCKRKVCGNCGGASTWSTCMECDPPRRYAGYKSGRLSNCCVWFMKANNIKFKE